MRSDLRQLARLLATLGLVVAVAAALLRLLDRVPEAIAGPEERTFASVTDLERSMQERLVLPSFFPSTIRWPPSRIRVVGRRPAVASLTLVSASDAGETLGIMQTLRETGVIPQRLALDGVVLDVREATVSGRPATLTRVLRPGGSTWHTLEWSFEGRTIRLQSQGSPAELLRIGASLHREGR